MTNERFHKLFGGPPRAMETRVTQRDMDLAASVQAVTEEIIMRAARFVHEQTGSKNLVLAGGVALNCVANGKILRQGPYEHIFTPPAAGDAGGALGVALFTWYQLLENPRTLPSPSGRGAGGTDLPSPSGRGAGGEGTRATDFQKGSLLGPAFTDDEIVE